MITQKHEIEKVPNSGYVLFIDGQESACPYQPPMMGQSPMGGAPQLVRIPCCTRCPLARITDGYKTNAEGLSEPCMKYVVSCGVSHYEYVVTEKEQPKQNPTGLVKSL